ncbi:hypothetical protein LYZ37_12800 [Vibrio tubiashii]|uniref:hypothetical protein n=1 Tax=Vibrio tubiashii TaxID=29498 RepID=UPI00234F55C2|nr:hypothetical protein [Vibrio tubiashii]WCP66715.1 hypothetical protein LYZ37_12800 [Vibrio tubiashii]
MSYTGYQEISIEQLEELENERLELIEGFKEHLALFCKLLNVDLDQQAAVDSISRSTQVRLSSHKHIPEKKDGMPIAGQGYLSVKMREKVKSEASAIVTNLARDIANSSQKLLVNDIILRGSPESIAEKLTLHCQFGHKRFYDVDPIPNVPSVHHYEVDAFSKRHLLDKVKEHYVSRYHRYRLWDGKAIAHLTSYLFTEKSQAHPFHQSPNLIHLLDDDPNPIQKEWFKRECLDCWLEFQEAPPSHAYTELAYPDDNGVIFDEYIPLTMVGEDVWNALYERYQNKLEEHIKYSV